MDETEYRERAIARSAAYVRRYLLLPSTFRRCMTSATVGDETYLRALHDVERRTIELRMQPARGRGYEEQPPSTETDPWSIDPETIEQASRRHCRCPACNGTASVRCDHCSGAGAVRCGRCSGTGRVMGSRNRTKKCPECRERGRVDCQACRAGFVACRSCGASGRVDAWLVMHRQRLRLVSTSGSAPGLGVHARVDQPDDFDAPHGWPSDLRSDEQIAPGEVPAGLEARVDTRTDRVLKTRVQTFASRVARVELATLLERRTV